MRKKENRQLYAMKILKKRDVVRRRQLAHVQAERDILAEADSEWVVKLFFSFQDSHALYLVMEYIPGGLTGAFLWNHFITNLKATRHILSCKELRLFLQNVLIPLGVPKQPASDHLTPVTLTSSKFFFNQTFHFHTNFHFNNNLYILFEVRFIKKLSGCNAKNLQHIVSLPFYRCYPKCLENLSTK